MKPLVLYHAGCWDGFCAAWVCRKALGDIEAVPVQHGTTPPDVTGRDVYIVDFSYPRDVLEEMAAKAKSLLVIDHHETAEAALKDLPYCIFDMAHSGARLTWDYFEDMGLFFPLFGPPLARPWLVDYTEDRDLWKHELPDTKEINAALRSYPLNFEVWDDLHQRGRANLVDKGIAIRAAEREVVHTHVRNAWEIEILGYKVLCVNATALFSETAAELAKDRPFGACYFDRKDGQRQWSLRSTEDGVNVSEIAKRFGGGGHKHAAGFQTPVPFGTRGPILPPTQWSRT